ncbi:MAG: DNA adenine methylase [Alphaproteobacteria bacterium]
MTSYHGGKQRIGKNLAEIIHKQSIQIENKYDFDIKGYCEPFCGMLGVYQHIPELFEDHKMTYKAGDINKSVIMMWKAAQKNWVPPTTSTEALYDKMKISKDSALRGYIGHQYSFGGQFFNGYSTKYGKSDNSEKASKNVVSISKKLKKITFSNKPYTYYTGLKGYIIYCDPPYSDTISRYSGSGVKNNLKFESSEFWDWCREMAEDNIIFISSYNAPKDFKKIFSSSHRLTGGSPIYRNRVENLYVL